MNMRRISATSSTNSSTSSTNSMRHRHSARAQRCNGKLCSHSRTRLVRRRWRRSLSLSLQSQKVFLSVRTNLNGRFAAHQAFYRLPFAPVFAERVHETGVLFVGPVLTPLCEHVLLARRFDRLVGSFGVGGGCGGRARANGRHHVVGTVGSHGG